MKLLLILAWGLLQTAHAQPNTQLEAILKKEFPEDSKKDGRWVFYPDNAYIGKIEMPLVKLRAPHYDFYRVTMTNYLGWHVNQGTCLVLYDSAKAGIVMVEPLWYGGCSQRLVELFTNKPFRTKDSLLGFIGQLHELMMVGSGYKFTNMVYTDTLVTCDLVYIARLVQVTGGNGVTSTVYHGEEGIWRRIRIAIKHLAITRYTAINPKDEEEDF